MSRNQNSGLIQGLFLLVATLVGAYVFYLILSNQRRQLAPRRSRALPSTESTDLPEFDLFAGLNWDTETDRGERYNRLIPHNAISESGRYARPFSKHFNISRLRRTHVARVLAGLYPKERSLAEMGTTAPIETVLACAEPNVCAVSRGIGMPIATGVLIAPDLFLTPRHAIEEIPIREIRVRQGYQLTENGMDYGACFEINGVIEENAELDYAVIKLSKPVADYKPLDLCLEDNYLGQSMFIHHPRGEPKQVSMHATLESDYHQFSYTGFHDSYPGSSGGVYINAERQLFGLHLLNNGTTTGRWMKTIWQNSSCLQCLYRSTGVYTAKSVRIKLSQETLQKTEFSKSHHNELERVGRPGNLPTLNLAGGRTLNLSYHHIIPIGDMEFLWVLGQEYPAVLGKLLNDMAFEKADDINAIAWAPWNLMVGPSDRTDDPHDGSLMEGRKPDSVSAKLWKALNQLHPAIQAAWQARYKLSKSNHFKQFREAEITNFDQLDSRGASTSRNINNITFGSVSALKKKPYNQYGRCLLNVLKRVRAVKQVIPKSNFSNAHKYVESDWLDTRHGRHAVY